MAAKESPICIFGPGGDYKKEYTPEPEAEKDGLLKKAISCVADSLISDGEESENSSQEQKSEYSKTEKKKLANTQKSRDTKIHKTVSASKSLSADDSGAGRTPSKKHHNRVRTLRKPAKRRFSVVVGEEGSLFGADEKGD
ncbi:hypothetical protein SMSP2_00554 [Limihaloglobus sulfuriphilus]|uniref:Uncharacterized protein n=1 Tax=Limihaloglobus sulfuriphilus TaxID=1851148 RepID=A0A1Q2MC03_9BACT|nr:hypothetical protein SMSP2_00554 [Limihaloglobus sulfuriphilus]